MMASSNGSGSLAGTAALVTGESAIGVAGARRLASIGALAGLDTAGWRATLEYQEMAHVGGGSLVAIPSIASTIIHRWFASKGLPMPQSITWWRWPRTNWAGSASVSTASCRESWSPTTSPARIPAPSLRRKDGLSMHILIAMLIGALVATGSVVVFVHDNTAVSPASTRVLYSYGSGG
jgi:hypothetical protein